jgi:uncharacterized membrane protein YphA (DoxX/SURF4 family)
MTLGIFVLAIAWQVSDRRHALTNPKFPLIGHFPEWLILVAGTGYGVIGGLLLVGAYTQVAALVAALGSIKLLVLARWYPELRLFPQSTYVLLLVIALALVAMGAGAYGFDLPL